MEREFVWKVVTGIGSAIVALLFAAWRLSRTWTRVESSVTASALAIERIEETVHGGPDRKNGLRESVGKIAVHTEQLNTRVSNLEARLNAGARTGPKTTRRKPGRPGGRRKDDR